MPEPAPCDLLVVGGGANGCAIARDAAGRGLKVTLVEQGDLAGATSSASTKLIHGGLRYLEYYEFRLVRESLAEREVLLRAAPHLIYPLRFVLPHHAGLRPAWLLRLGLFLYDHIGGGRTLPATRTLDLAHAPEGAPLKPEFKRGFAYSDCWTDDARMVALTAVDAAERGARVLTRTRLLSARREGALWRTELQTGDGARETVQARALVNAAGPWVDEVARLCGRNAQAEVKLVKGSHIVLPRLYQGDHAYTLQESDGRVVFAIPYADDFTLVGTTDVPLEGGPRPLQASPEEIAYLCEALGGYFERTVSPADVVWTYSGARPLHDEGRGKSASAATRDYKLELDAPDGGAATLTVYGGKITTFRKLGEHALDLLAKPLGVSAKAWTRDAVLPGGDLPGGFEAFRAETRAAAAVAGRAAPDAPVPRLRLAPRPGAGRGEGLGRPGPRLRRGPERTRDRPSEARGVGAGGGRRTVAPLQARPAHERRPARRRGRPVPRRRCGNAARGRAP